MKKSSPSSKNSRSSSSNISSSIDNDLDNSKINFSGYYSHRAPEKNHQKNEQIYKSDEEMLRLHSRSEGNIRQGKEISNVNKEKLEDQKPFINFESRESTKREPSIKQLQLPVKVKTFKYLLLKANACLSFSNFYLIKSSFLCIFFKFKNFI